MDFSVDVRGKLMTTVCAKQRRVEVTVVLLAVSVSCINKYNFRPGLKRIGNDKRNPFLCAIFLIHNKELMGK